MQPVVPVHVIEPVHFLVSLLSLPFASAAAAVEIAVAADPVHLAPDCKVIPSSVEEADPKAGVLLVPRRDLGNFA